MRARTLSTIACAITALGAFAPAASAQEPAPQPRTGGAMYGPDDPALTAVVPGDKAIMQANGMAAAPELAPEPVKQALVERTRRYLVNQDMRGLVAPQIEAGMVGGNARAIGAATSPLFERYFMNGSQALSAARSAGPR